MATVTPIVRHLDDSSRLTILAEEAGTIASRIDSLAKAANCVMTGAQPADALVRETVVTDLLALIEDLAANVAHDTGAIEAVMMEVQA